MSGLDVLAKPGSVASYIYSLEKRTLGYGDSQHAYKECHNITCFSIK